MLGAGERRLVLLDFLLTVLLWARTGSSAMHGYGREVSQRTHGAETGDSPHALGPHRFPLPCTGWGLVSEGATAALREALPLTRGHRFRSHRCGFPARHWQHTSLPPSGWRRHQTPPPSRPWQRGREARRGATVGSTGRAQPVPGSQRPCRNAASSPSCSLLQAVREGARSMLWDGVLCPRLGDGTPRTPLTCRCPP